MPRRSRRDGAPAQRRRGHGPGPPIEVSEIAARIAGPPWAITEGFEVRNTAGTKRYRCPYCNGWIEPGISHVVAFQTGHPEDRRHYHAGCWVRHRAGAR